MSLNLMKYEIPAMQQSGGGAIANISSQGALLGVATYGACGAAKAGVIALSRAAAAEYSVDRIRLTPSVLVRLKLTYGQAHRLRCWIKL
jgi:NAD(P)-dependent dehydrogenase (short-subunit alcohol dehydrogenase family)